MSSVKGIQGRISTLKGGGLAVSEILRFVDDPAALVRVNALFALVPFGKSEPSIVAAIEHSALNPYNAIRLMGTTTVAHIAVGCLLQIDTPESIQSARRVCLRWNDSERSDLFWYLKGEKIVADPESVLAIASRIPSPATTPVPSEPAVEV